MITVEKLNFTYPGNQTPTLKALDFSVVAGEIFGFLGPSGAGKSTTQKILNGLIKGFEGNVMVLGKALEKWGADYYERIGVSFESPNHFLKLTARENLTYFGALYQNRVKDPETLLALVGLEKDADLFVSQYSKGMKNRLSVARSLLHDPELLFMDEPTAGLDPVNARRIKDLLKLQKKAGKTIFLATHDMHVASELCDRVAFIVDGEIKLVDSPSALQLKYGQPKVHVEYCVNEHAAGQDFPLAGLAQNIDFQTLLRSGTLQTIHSQEASLEEIFIRVTGRSLQ